MTDRQSIPWQFDRLPLHRSTTVLMPSTTLTYHLLDPVQQAVAREALNADGFMAVAFVGEDAELDGSEPVPEVVTLAEITRAARPHPGRLVVELTGIARLQAERSRTVKLDVTQPESAAIPVVSGRVCEERNAEAPGVDALRRDALAALQRLADGGVPLAGSLQKTVERLDAPGAAPDVLAAFGFDTPASHQEFLEETDVRRRLRRVEARLGELADELNG